MNDLECRQCGEPRNVNVIDRKLVIRMTVAMAITLATCSFALGGYYFFTKFSIWANAAEIAKHTAVLEAHEKRVQALEMASLGMAKDVEYVAKQMEKWTGEPRPKN